MLVKPPEICGSGAAVDPVRVLGEVDDRPRVDLVVEDDGEVARERLRRSAPAAGPIACGGAALGDPAGDVLEGLAAVVGEAEGDVGLVEFVEVPASGSVMSVPESAGRSLQRVPARVGVLDRLAARSRWAARRRRPCPAAPRATSPLRGPLFARSALTKRSFLANSGPAISLCVVALRRRGSSAVGCVEHSVHRVRGFCSEASLTAS